MKKLLAFLLSATVCLSLCACSNDSGDEVTDSQTSETTEAGQVERTIYLMNYRPDADAVLKEIAQTYQSETGIPVKVVTAESGTYEDTLTTELGKENPPTIFQINGNRGYTNWADYCEDISDTALYEHLSDKNLAITDGDGVYGIPYVIEGYGIIYNNDIMKNYFESEKKSTKYTSIDEIKSFSALKAVVEDMTLLKDELGIRGVFAPTSLKSGEDWRWHSHLANIPMYYEYKNNNVDLTSGNTNNVQFQYSDNFRNIFDLYLNNSTIDRAEVGNYNVSDSINDFATGQCAMMQNGNWAWNQIIAVDKNVVEAEDIGFIPIYMGIEGEENQGLCIGSESYFAINSNASDADQKLAEDFLYWMFSSEKGKDYVINKLGYIAPFDTFTESDIPNNPLSKQVVTWINREDVQNIPWTGFTMFPDQNFRDNFGSSLLGYANGSGNWEDVTGAFTTGWGGQAGTTGDNMIGNTNENTAGNTDGNMPNNAGGNMNNNTPNNQTKQ